MATFYRYRSGGVEHGPINSRQLKDLALSGRLRPEDQVRREDSDHWHAASKFRGLFDPEPTTEAGTGPADAPPAPDATAPTTPPPSGSPAAPAPRSKVPQALERGLQEARATARATAEAARNAVEAGRGRLHEHRLRRAAREASVALGERLFRAGLGDAVIRTRIEQLDARILELATARSSTRTAGSERIELLARLGEPFLDHDEVPEAPEEHARAREARAALGQHVEGASASRQPLLPADRRQRRRVLSGLAVAAVAFLAAGFLLSRGNGPSPEPGSDPSANLEGFVGDGQQAAEEAAAPGSDAKEQARAAMQEAGATLQQAQAQYNASQEQYRQARNNSLANAGRFGAMGLQVAAPTRPDDSLYREVLRAQQAYEQARAAYESFP